MHTNSLVKSYLTLISSLIIIFFILLITSPVFGQGALWINNFADYMADIFNPALITLDEDPFNVMNKGIIKHFYYGAFITDADRAYPPFAYLLFRLMAPMFSFASNADVMFAHYIMMMGAVLYILLLFNNLKGNNIIKTLIIISFLLSGVFMYTMERGNIILHAALLSGFFLFYHNSNKKIIRELALISLCAAVNIKITPMILGLFLLQQKRYFEIVRCVIYCCLMFFLPLLHFEGSILEQINKFIYNLNCFGAAYFQRGYPELQYITSLSVRENLLHYFDCLSKLLSVYAVVAFFFQRTLWKKVALLSLFIYASSNLSAFYVFIYFFVFITMFLSQSKYNKKDYIYMLLVVMMLNPLQIYISGINISHDLILAAMITMLLLLDFECFGPLTDWILNKIKRNKLQQQIG